jgi:3-hydroxyisobutyrate dehydrogenase
VSDKPVLGFIGIGLMGRPMSLHLCEAGYEVHVFNRTKSKLAPLLDAGAIESESPPVLTRAADIVFTCVSDTASMERVVFGPGGIAEGAAENGAGKVLVDHSSIRPDATRDMAARLRAETGMGWVDAPVSGGVAGAEEASLAIMCGGDAADVERVRPVVMNMCSRLTHMGPQGAGQTTKLCNQMVVVCTVAVLAEMVNMGQEAGIDAARLPEALAGGWADSKPLQLFVPRMAAGDFDPPFGHVATLLKDIDTATDLGRSQGTALPMSATAAELLRLMGSHGYLDKDPSELVRLYQDLVG